MLIDLAVTLSVNVGVRGLPTLWSPATALTVLTQCIVAALNDVALVWCLAPAALAGVLLPAHVFQPGAFTTEQRLLSLLAKWRLYTAVGLVTGALAAVVTATLAGEPQLLAPRLLVRAALTGALHLGVSSNLRYQAVNGIEVLLYGCLSTSLARACSAALRMGNNVVGGLSWMLLAEALGRAIP